MSIEQSSILAGIERAAAYGRLSKEEVRRIAACVNACSGVSTETLERLPFSAAVAAEASRHAEVARWRDAAITELHTVSDFLQSGDWSVLRGDGRMTLPYADAEKVADRLTQFLLDYAVRKEVQPSGGVPMGGPE